jgi:uncharacterized membrane protein
MNIQKIYPYILIIGSAIGLLASFILIVDTIKFIENPDVKILCNINPLVSCVNVASKWQSSIFGFPNPILGIIAFSMLFAVGVMLFSGGRSKKPLWILVNLGALAAMIFIMWFFYESIYDIGSLCIYCMTVWAVTWPLFLYTTVWNFREGHFVLPSRNNKQKYIDSFFHFVSKYHAQILTLWYIAIVFLILFHFRDFFFV